jgi:hypothetical protein
MPLFLMNGGIGALWAWRLDGSIILGVLAYGIGEIMDHRTRGVICE